MFGYNQMSLKVVKVKMIRNSLFIKNYIARWQFPVDPPGTNRFVDDKEKTNL